MTLARKHLAALLAGLVSGSFLISIGLHAQTLAFPGAQGFGRFATGGRGGTVYHVTNLNDAGSGSFRDAVSAANRTVVFDVGGLVRITNRISVAQNITIAGQTAPGEGITVYGNGISFSGAHNTIARFIRFRQGVNGDNGTDAATMTGNSHDMIFDHLSVSWGLDETFSISSDSAPYPTNITIQSTIISQGLQDHSAGGLIQTPGGVSIVRALYIDNDTRNPKFKFNHEYVNNVVYGWETAAYIMGGDSAGDSYANAFNNYFINGANGGGAGFSGGNENYHIYATNNWQDSNRDGVLNGAEIPFANYGPMDLQTTPFPYPISNALPPLTALKLAISDVGASQHRDIVDERMITELTSWGTLGETVSSEFEAPMSGPGTIKGGVAPLDTDQDGLPDFWEAALGMATNAPNNNHTNASGYTDLEEYLNWLAEPHDVAQPDAPVDIDLWQFTRGFTNHSPVYSVTNATNGTAVLRPDGHRVRFTPNAALVGPASFQFTVVDGEGSTITRTMNLFFTPQAPTRSLVWRGDGVTNNWNVAGDFNWFDDQALLYPFTNGASVVFNDTGYETPTVHLAGSLQPATVTVEAAKNYTFDGGGSLDGYFVLNKAGSSTLTLANTNSGFGSIIVSNGSLFVNGDLPQSTVTVRAGATLGGNGKFGSVVSLNNGATLAPGQRAGAPGTLTLSNGITLAGGITLRIDLSDDPTGMVKTNDQIIISNGNLALSSTNTIQVNLLDGPLANGVYTLISHSGALIGNLASLKLIGANGVLTNPPGAIAIFVDNTRPPADLTWLGDGVNNIWDNGTNANWVNTGLPDWFYFGDTVRFDDSGSTNPPVSVKGAVSPANVIVDATNNYSFGGNGKISGTSGLLKTNSGTLTISTTNDYTGVTTIAGGAIAITRLPNGGSSGPIGASSTNPANLMISGGTLRYLGPTVATDRGLTLDGEGGVIQVEPPGTPLTTLTLNGLITGNGTLTKRGASTLSMDNVNNYTGGTIIQQGSVLLANINGLGNGPVTLDGTTNPASLVFGAGDQVLANTVNIVGTNNYIRNAGNETITDLTGSGTLHLATNSGITFTLSGDMSGFSGTISADAVHNLRFYPSTGSANAIIDLRNTSTLLNTRNGGLTIQIGALIGGPNTQLQGASSGVNQGDPTIYVIGGKNLDTTFAGKITEVIPARTVMINKVGTGTLTLSNANTYTGGTVIDAGTLLVRNTSGSGTGTNSVVVNGGGTLGGTGIILGPVTVNSGGAIAPGASVGTLTLRSNLTLSAGSILRFELGATNASDRIVITNALVLNGTLHVTNVAGFGPGTYTLIDYGGALSGSEITVGSKPSGYSCTVDTDTLHQVRLVVQAQTPPVFGSIVISNGALVCSGSNGLAGDTYYLLASTNITLPLDNWERVATNQFDEGGHFLISNTPDSTVGRQYYRLQLP